MTGACVPQPLALSPYPQPSAPILLALGGQNIARLNTMLLFNFEVVITLKLQTKYFFVFVLIINNVKSKKL